MKKYNTNFIKSYIEEHKAEIETVSCGMREDWGWTHKIVYSDGKFSTDCDWDSKNITVAGISGSAWATPVMEIEFKDGRTEIIDCYIDDGNESTAADVARMKSFAAATGGMDYLG